MRNPAFGEPRTRTERKSCIGCTHFSVNVNGISHEVRCTRYSLTTVMERNPREYREGCYEPQE